MSPGGQTFSISHDGYETAMAKKKPDEDPGQPKGRVPSPEPGPPTKENRPVGTVPRWAHKGPMNIPTWGDQYGDESGDESGTRPGSAPTGSE